MHYSRVNGTAPRGGGGGSGDRAARAAQPHAYCMDSFLSCVLKVIENGSSFKQLSSALLAENLESD